ncbi:MAG: DUF1272 domain-containing protein [Tetrasphaera sp.]|nr:DUF1272 domain-containing protein [Tetrasphaera sp.]
MLDMLPACQRCGAAVPFAAVAYICSYECTYCPECCGGPLKQVCPTCGGELRQRPRRIEPLIRDESSS